MGAWINVIVAALIMVATLPGRTQGLGLITEPLLRDLRLDRVSYALGPLLFARCAEFTGSYMPALWVLAPAVAGLGAAALRGSLPTVSSSPAHAGASGIATLYAQAAISDGQQRSDRASS